MNNIKRIKIEFSYAGEGFCGFQRQESQRTVQGEIEKALTRIFASEIDICASGRTDAGVHALAQTADFLIPASFDENKLISALNFYLPDDVRVFSATGVDLDFNSRKSAKKKTYLYNMYISDIDCPLLVGRAFRLKSSTNIDLMADVAKIFVGEHDFFAFHAKGSSAKSTIRTVYECQIEKYEIFNKLGIRLRISANGFLYKMVRIIAGSLLLYAQGKVSKEYLCSLLENPNDFAHKFTAPPEGLYLLEVKY